MIRSGGFAVLCGEIRIQQLIDRTSIAAGRDSVVVDSVGQLVATLADCEPCAVVIDREHQDADSALVQLAGVASTILVVSDSGENPPPGARIVAFESSLPHALALAASPPPIAHVRIGDLLGVTVLGGDLAAAAEQIAIAFGVERCVLSVRGDVGVGRTADPTIWNHIERCRIAMASAATLLAVTTSEPPRCESYAAVALADHGFLGLVSAEPRCFTLDEHALLQAMAARLSFELVWRAAHEHVDAAPAAPVGLTGYRMRHEISRGAMGVVYRADDLALARPVAIKMLRADLAADAVFVERLRSEAMLLARLQHPNLVQIYHFGQLGNDTYFVMELVEGEALDEAIARHRSEGTRPSLAVNVAVIEEIASALDSLHEHGIIHRDVKPANVIRDPFRGRGVLVDVGIAHRLGEIPEAAGTPGYIAPEVFDGGEATARADVYGLAATAYAILTLAEPFGEGTSLETLARQATDTPPARPSSHVAELAPADEIILAGLHHDPAQRPASAGEFARALSAALAVVAPSPRIRARVTGARAQTRGVVFRSIVGVLGVHAAARLRFSIGEHDPVLADSLVDAAPLAWLPTDMFERFLAIAPEHIGDTQLARNLARACVRASFRRFFPSSTATLMPERTLSAIRNVWSRYHTWGDVAALPIQANESRVRMTGTPRNAQLCQWSAGLLEQLVILSGGGAPVVEHVECEALGGAACEFHVRWT